MRNLAACLLALLCAAAGAQEPLPYDPSQPGYRDADLELARYCLQQGLVSECKRIATKAGDAELAKSCEGKTDTYTAAAWGGYLDRREAVQKRRGLGAANAGLDAQSVLYVDPDHAASREQLGQKWLQGLGWLSTQDHTRLAPLVLNDFSAATKAPREATWETPFVLAGKHFTLVTDLPWARAVKYSGLLDKFHDYYFALVGDVIAQRSQPNVVWCCKDAATFVSHSQAIGMPMAASNGGMHVGALGAVLINAERCDEVGRRNKARDNLARTLFHECSHRLTESGLRGRQPFNWDLAMTREHAWIVEAIAVVFEDLNLEGQKPLLKGLEDQRKYTIDKFWKGKTGKVPALGPILAQGSQDFGTEQPVSSIEKYAVVGSLAWYCLFEKKDKYRTAFLALLVDYYRGDTKGRDFEARFGIKQSDFETDWKTWVVK
ncbi:MAG: hypothetical protein IPP14_04880 [Planctomycetes bacterium]|nr:hypothetical protein [Planctomycetota bacterium]